MRIITLIFGMFFWSSLYSQERQSSSIKDLSLLEGKWKAVASDSSFSSFLEYRFSPKKKLLMATNHLYGQEGQSFGVYEGAYFLEVDKFAYFLSGPNGETHKGHATINGNTITHLARIYPGKTVKAYKSEMVFRDGKLFYYANYSEEEKFPKKVDYSEPLIYERSDL